MSTLSRRGAGAACTSTSSASPSPSPSCCFPLSPSPLVCSSSSSSSSSSSDDLSPLSLATHVVNERAAQKLNSIHVKGKAAVYFTVSTLFVFVILSNSLSRFLKTIWSDVGNNWAYAWAWLESWNFSPATLYIGFGFGVHLSIFWTYTAILTYFDFKPADQNPLSRWKMQPGKNEPVEPARYRYAVWIALRNQFFVHLPVLLMTFPMVQWRGMSFTLPLPTFNEFLCDISVALVVEELMFYYSHRLFHHGAIYGYIHKFHHEWTAPIGIATIYAHPLEHLMSNLAPVFVGPFIMRSHIATTWVWQSVAVIVAMNTHSGYHLPFMPSPEAHDYHHLKFNQNYGVLGILDYMHGTDAMFRASKQFSRHRTLFSFDDAEFARPVPRQTITVTNKDEQKNDQIKEKEKECDIKEGKQVETHQTTLVI